MASKKQDKTEKEGVVIETLPNTSFKVKLQDGKEVLAHLSGKMRLYHVRVLQGDEVVVEFSPYDDSRGRIVYRKR